MKNATHRAAAHLLRQRLSLTPIVALPVAPPVVVSGLPVVPTVRGAPIDVRVRYPADNQLLTGPNGTVASGRFLSLAYVPPAAPGPSSGVTH